MQLKRQHIERGLQLTARVLIPGAPSHFNALLIEHARLLHVAKESGEFIQIQYVFEKDCWPTEHGNASGLTNETSRRQADVFLESYLRRRNAT